MGVICLLSDGCLRICALSLLSCVCKCQREAFEGEGEGDDSKACCMMATLLGGVRASRLF